MAIAIVRTVLNYKNYDEWSSQIKTYLLAEDLWDVLDQEPPKTEDEEKAEGKAWKKKDAKALYAIQNSCVDDTYKLIKYKTTSKQAWDTLSKRLKKSGEPTDEQEKMSVLHAYPTLIPSDHGTRPEVSMEEGRTGGAGHDEIQETFVKYVKSNDWDNAIELLRQNRQVGGARIPIKWHGTALHCAILNIMSCSVRVIQQLVDLMAKEHLKIRDMLGCTALYYIIKYYPEGVEVAECMVKKNRRLLTIFPLMAKVPLVVVAQGKTKGEGLARYFYSITPHETLEVRNAAQLIHDGFYHNRFDIAWDLIQRYPELAMAKDRNGNIPLITLASNRFAFKSGSRLSLWEKLIYYGIRIKPLPPIDKEKPESDHSDQRHISNKKENQWHSLISSGMSLFRGPVSLFRGPVRNLKTFLGITSIYEMKLIHERVKQLLPLMCKAVKDDRSHYQVMKLKEAMCVAAERGHVEYITHFLKYSSYPVFFVRNEKEQNLMHIAAECRHHKIYNLIYVLFELRKKENRLDLDQSDYIRTRVGLIDHLGNNMLHTVASITPLSQIDHIQGAALQMQRELQWFKEVESIADPKDFESVNTDNKSPRKIFTENHKELGKEAEKSMKETATSCTVVGALIVTMMFAAAFTVPGGNNENTGLPTFLTKKVFTAFIVSNAISLFSSTTSVIMFLGILTSRFSENDFYKSLPTKMIIGLFTLFLSIATMMIVFSCALYIMINGKSSIVIPSILLASIPVTSFVWIQFPLLVELFISTFGQGIFDRNQKKFFEFLCYP